MHTKYKCELTSCKGKPIWKATKLWGKGGVIYTCDEHKPGKSAKPGQKIWYRIEPMDPKTNS